MKYTLSVICLLMVLSSAAIAATRDAPTITPLTDTDIAYLGSSVPGTGLVGNINAPVYTIADWFWGDEGYKYLFNPLEELDCQTGFRLETVHMVVAFDTTMVPVTFDAYVDLESAVWDGACFIPGPEECVSEPVSFTITEPGIYDLAIPIDCACAYPADPAGRPYMYMLSMHFQGFFDMNLVSDAMPTPCTVFNLWDGSGGWYDLFGTFSGAGNLLIYGETVCCDDPVTEESETWGTIKGLYK